MSGEARDIFFSDKNLEFTYGVVVQNVEKKTGSNIQKHPSFKQVFSKMATSIYDKTHGESRNLITLNSNLIEKSTEYIQSYINKQRGQRGLESAPQTDYNGRPIATQAAYNPTLGFTVQAPKPNLNADMARLQQQYMPPVQYPAAGATTTTTAMGKADNSDLKSKYNSFLSARDNDLGTNTGMKGLSYTESDTDKKIGQDPMAQLRAAAQRPISGQSQGYNLQPFALSPDFLGN
jgi:hypothetical protein